MVQILAAAPLSIEFHADVQAQREEEIKDLVCHTPLSARFLAEA